MRPTDCFKLKLAHRTYQLLPLFICVLSWQRQRLFYYWYYDFGSSSKHVSITHVLYICYFNETRPL